MCLPLGVEKEGNFVMSAKLKPNTLTSSHQPGGLPFNLIQSYPPLQSYILDLRLMIHSRHRCQIIEKCSLLEMVKSPQLSFFFTCSSRYSFIIIPPSFPLTTIYTVLGEGSPGSSRPPIPPNFQYPPQPCIHTCPHPPPLSMHVFTGNTIL